MFFRRGNLAVKTCSECKTKFVKWRSHAFYTLFSSCYCFTAIYLLLHLPVIERWMVFYIPRRNINTPIFTLPLKLVVKVIIVVIVKCGSTNSHLVLSLLCLLALVCRVFFIYLEQSLSSTPKCHLHHCTAEGRRQS